jgi:hypothetical protein
MHKKSVLRTPTGPAKNLPLPELEAPPQLPQEAFDGGELPF